MSGYFITGIGTDVGKTICAAILSQGLKYDYWKPVQCGGAVSDCEWIRRHTSGVKVHVERYCFAAPVSPHTAAEKEFKTIELSEFSLPCSSNGIIVEGAGGLYVPLNHSFFMIDLVRLLELPVIVVAHFYVGAINHTILTLKLLKDSGVVVKGLIANGSWSDADMTFIESYCDLPILGVVPWAESLDASFIDAVARERWVCDLLS